jgi:hypothetical protein
MKKTKLVLSFIIVVATLVSLAAPAAASDKDLGDYWIENGVLYQYFGSDPNVVIPSGVTEIRERAFSNSRVVKTVSIPETVRTIGEEAFYNSTIESIVIPDGVTSIGARAFSKSAISSIILPNKLTTITEGVFAGCRQLTSIIIPVGVKTIGEEAFSYCDLITVIIPEGAVSIGKRAFEMNTGLKSIIIPDSVTYIGATEDGSGAALESTDTGNDMNSAFYMCGDLIIYGAMNSYAFQYAEAHEIPFIDLSITPETADMATAVPVSATVLVNNEKVLFNAYNIAGYTYVKLRDVAMAVNNTDKNFNVTWNSNENAIDILTKTEYEPIGSEMTDTIWSSDVNAAKSTSNVFVDGRSVSIGAYYINGSNFLKLRDIGSAVGIVVIYDSNIKTISIFSNDTSIYDSVVGTWKEDDGHYDMTISFSYGGVTVWPWGYGTYSINNNKITIDFGNFYFYCTYEIKNENGYLALYLSDETGTLRFIRMVSK